MFHQRWKLMQESNLSRKSVLLHWMSRHQVQHTCSLSSWNNFWIQINIQIHKYNYKYKYCIAYIYSRTKTNESIISKFSQKCIWCIYVFLTLELSFPKFIQTNFHFLAFFFNSKYTLISWNLWFADVQFALNNAKDGRRL